MALAVAEARNPNHAPCKSLLIPVGSEVRIEQYSTLAFIHLWFSWFLTRFHDVQSSWANISNIFFDRSSILHFKINQNIESSENKLSRLLPDPKIKCDSHLQPTREDSPFVVYIASIQVLLSSSVLFYSTAASFSAWRGVSSSWHASGSSKKQLVRNGDPSHFLRLAVKVWECTFKLLFFFRSVDSTSDFWRDDSFHFNHPSAYWI